MKYKASRDFYSIGTKKSYKKGQELKEDEKFLKEWTKSGTAEQVKEAKKPSKRKTKELKTDKKTK